MIAKMIASVFFCKVMGPVFGLITGRWRGRVLLIVLASLIAADLESPRPIEVTNVVRQNVLT